MNQAAAGEEGRESKEHLVKVYAKSQPSTAQYQPQKVSGAQTTSEPPAQRDRQGGTKKERHSAQGDTNEDVPVKTATGGGQSSTTLARHVLGLVQELCAGSREQDPVGAGRAAHSCEGMASDGAAEGCGVTAECTHMMLQPLRDPLPDQASNVSLGEAAQSASIPSAAPGVDQGAVTQLSRTLGGHHQ